MKATEKELFTAIAVYNSYINAKANLDKINEILSLHKAGNELGGSYRIYNVSHKNC